jgi:ubiquinone/menaquinone biosynthesis C-methylase UbiE
MPDDFFKKPGTGGFLNPDEVVEELKIAPGMKIADFGCGSGYLAFSLAKKTGSDGKVYAIDVLPSALESIRSQAKLRNIYNIEPVRADLEMPGSLKLPDESCDMVVMANILFQAKKKAEVVSEANRILKSEGAMVFLEWRPDAKIGPPSAGMSVSAESVKKIVKELKLNLILEREFEAGSHHYGLIFKKA